MYLKRIKYKHKNDKNVIPPRGPCTWRRGVAGRAGTGSASHTAGHLVETPEQSDPLGKKLN